MHSLSSVGCALWALSSLNVASAQTTDVGCRPVSERKAEAGCWIIVAHPVGQLASPRIFWHLDTYPTHSMADSAKGARGTVIESFGKVWLLSIESLEWRAPPGGEHVSVVGPLPITTGATYTAQYLEAVFLPGMTSAVHVHGGPEAWYTLSGETCLETPEGKQIGRAGGDQVIVPGGPPMHLTATGTEQRRALVLILHDSSRPATTIVHDWTPKGLCKGG
jgi:quercetin dioxygenase-like cupin family protein